ncbi:MAG: hypothetical protein ACTHUY_08885 [Flaviflexus sp.]|uniref:hypothetical protein n=1 Tax=Flaviflexus sp. TaxID=1969482 RepID=UPI003F8DE01A
MATRLAFASILGLLLPFVLFPAPQAQGANADNFDPGYIISDAEFYDWDSMNSAEVQDFFEDVNPRCVPGPDGTPCLQDYREDTPQHSREKRMHGTRR